MIDKCNILCADSKDQHPIESLFFYYWFQQKIVKNKHDWNCDPKKLLFNCVFIFTSDRYFIVWIRRQDWGYSEGFLQTAKNTWTQMDLNSQWTHSIRKIYIYIPTVYANYICAQYTRSMYTHGIHEKYIRTVSKIRVKLLCLKWHH